MGEAREVESISAQFEFGTDLLSAFFRSWKLNALRSTRNRQTLAIHNFCDVQVKEVHIQNSLDTARYDGDLVNESFMSVSVIPVGDVEHSVKALEEQVVAGNTFGFASLGDHLKLWHNGDTFQVNRKCPQKFNRVEVVMHQKGQSDCRNEDELDAELVAFFVIG